MEVRRVCLTFISSQTGGGVGGVSWGCGRRGSQAGLNDRALFSAAAPVSIWPGQTIAGVTGLLRPGMRGLMSQDLAGGGSEEGSEGLAGVGLQSQTDV